MYAYRGFDAYIVAKRFEVPIWSTTTGRMKKEEKELDIIHLPWIQWDKFMRELKKSYKLKKIK